MVAPVVLITAAAIFANGLQNTYTEVAARQFALNSERMIILSGPDGRLTDPDSLSVLG